MSSTAISIVQSSQSRTPFCDQYFKGLRVLASSVAKVSLAAFYYLGALFCHLYDEEQSSYYKALSNYHFWRASVLDVYLEFGGEVIDFSINCSDYLGKSSPESEDLWELLKDRFEMREKEINYWKKNGQVLPNREYLSTAKEGFCAGMSYDFILKYLEQMNNKEVEPLDVVKSISGRYTKGAPQEAQFYQIFHQSASLLEKSIGLKQLKSQEIAFLKVEETVKNALSDGVYEVTFVVNEKDQKAHSIAFIKSSENCFIFDPNFATLVVKSENVAERFSKIAQWYYENSPSKEQFQIKFTSYQLSDWYYTLSQLRKSNGRAMGHF